jgi:hypothetical protein
MNEEGKNFDWVTALSECSLSVVFEELRQQVKGDVDKAQSQRPKQAHYGFRFVSTSTKSFSVLVEGNKIRGTIWFENTGKEISVRGENDFPKLSATVTLNKDRECRIRIDGQEYELWQMRRMALETLFFYDY